MSRVVRKSLKGGNEMKAGAQRQSRPQEQFSSKSPSSSVEITVHEAGV